MLSSVLLKLQKIPVKNTKPPNRQASINIEKTEQVSKCSNYFFSSWNLHISFKALMSLIRDAFGRRRLFESNSKVEEFLHLFSLN